MRGDEERWARVDCYFQKQKTIKVYESLLLSPGGLVRPQGAMGLARSPMENCSFLFVYDLCEFQEDQAFSYSNIRTKNTFQSLFHCF